MKRPSLWERYLTKEIGIEFKACLYFFAILFFYCMYRLCLGKTVADMIHMAEMIGLAYLVGYLQVYLLWNFDEADTIAKTIKYITANEGSRYAPEFMRWCHIYAGGLTEIFM